MSNHKPPSNTYQLGNEDFDTQFDMDMQNIEAFEKNLQLAGERKVEDVLPPEI